MREARDPPALATAQTHPGPCRRRLETAVAVLVPCPFWTLCFLTGRIAAEFQITADDQTTHTDLCSIPRRPEVPSNSLIQLCKELQEMTLLVDATTPLFDVEQAHLSFLRQSDEADSGMLSFATSRAAHRLGHRPSATAGVCPRRRVVADASKCFEDEVTRH